MYIRVYKNSLSGDNFTWLHCLFCLNNGPKQVDELVARKTNSISISYISILSLFW